MTERPVDPTVPVLAAPEPESVPGPSGDPHVETHATFWQRIEDATREQPRGDGFDAWESSFQRPTARGTSAAAPASQGPVTERPDTGDHDPLVTWSAPTEQRSGGMGNDDAWGIPATGADSGRGDATDAAEDAVVSSVTIDPAGTTADSTADDLMLDSAPAAPGRDQPTDASASLPSKSGEGHTSSAADRTPVGGEMAIGGSLLSELGAVAATLDDAAGGDRPEFDRQVTQLREILEQARSRPRDLDTMIRLSEKLETITELVEDHQRMARATREAARRLGGPAR